MGELGVLPGAYLVGEKPGKNDGVELISSLTGLDVSGFIQEWESWNSGDLVRSLGTVVLCVVAWFARILLVFLPQRIPLYGISSALESLSSGCGGSHDVASASLDSEVDLMNVRRSGAIGRALLQVLFLVNDLPASSSKYAFARGLAEKLIRENVEHGHGYEDVNRFALSAGFKRTLIMLNRSLEVQHRRGGSGDLWSLPLKALRMLPIFPAGGLNLTLPRPFSFVWSRIGYVFPWLSGSIASSRSGVAFSAHRATIVGDTEMAEKLAQELLWLAEKMAQALAVDEGIAQWSSSTSLASISLTSPPRVQRALVRLSALFAKELVVGNTEVARDVRFKMLLLWLPLFCTATHGGDGPIFTVSETMDVENTLDKAITALSQSDQEVIMAIWLQEFAYSSSDWPNLQSSYDRWCNATRNLGHPECVAEH